MKIFFFICCLAAGSSCVAQNYDVDSLLYSAIEKNKGEKIKLVDQESGSRLVEYFFNVQAGSLIGCSNCKAGKGLTFSATTVHGVTMGKKFRTGIGLGFDSYQNWQTLPLYGMASWDLIGNKNKSALFLQLSYGWAHPWFIRDGEYNYYATDPFNSAKGGKMVNPSIGYRLKYHDLKLSIGVGYKFQRIFYKSDLYYYCSYCDFGGPSQNLEITQDFNRVQVMMSVGWK